MSRALVFEGKGRLVKKTIEPRAQNILRVIQTSICGSDKHLFNGRLGEIGPLVLGHEVVGTIDALDSPGTLHGEPVKLGDRVILVPGINCGCCFNCLIRKQYCSQRFVYGFTGYGDHPELNGAFSDFMDLKPGTKVFKVPNLMSNDTAVFVELMACAVGSVEKITGVTNLTLISNVLVIGAGPAGICNYIAAEFYGMNVYLADVQEAALELAHKVGINKTFFMKDSNLTNKFDVVIDCAGTAGSFQTACEAVSLGGIVIEFGAFTAGTPINDYPFWIICQKDITIRGLAETLDQNFPLAIRILNETKYDIQQLLTHRYQLDDCEGIIKYLSKPVLGKGVVIS
ncbi:MAG: zinc-dependent alcohol dehydrogenase [Ruminiclostridium sp.]